MLNAGQDERINLFIKLTLYLSLSFSFRVFYRNLALLHLCVLLLPFIVLLKIKHTTLAENDENLISARSQGPNI